ncbi:MAG: signal peptidase II [Tepidisphaeraceae bacterium]|jgi:signal peptidase II
MRSSNWKNPLAVMRFCLTAAIGLSSDLLVKHWADVRLESPDVTGRMPSVDVIPGWLAFEWTPNHGAALGFFQGYRWLFLAVSVVAVVFLGYLFAASRRNQWGYQIILGMLVAGVLGNMYDRVTLGYVRDMIHIFPGRRFPDAIAQHLPAFWSTPEWFPWIFNIADSMLCVGVALMMLHSLFQQPHAPRDDSTAALPPSGQPNPAEH